MELPDDGGPGFVRQPCADDDSTSTSSCVSEELDTNEDAQILRLLDAVDRLLSCRDSLATCLSQGWMEIARARYSMGPSRIDQALFSLKPSPASMLVSFSTLKDFNQDEASAGESEEACYSQKEGQFSLRLNDASVKPQSLTAKADAMPESQLRQRHPSVKQHAENYSEDGEVLDREGHMTQDVRMSKDSDTLAWFGALVSPHLRSAKTSFKDALEIVVEMATVQSSLLSAYRQIQGKDELLCEDVL